MKKKTRSPAVVGLIVIVLVVVGTFLAFTKDIPFLNEPYEIRAAFRDGSGMKKGSPVRIAGVEVGEVTNVKHTSPGAQSVTATLAIRDPSRPIHRDAAAKIRPRIFLEGNFYVDLQPGTPQAREMPEQGIIPATRTSNPVQVGEVLSMLTSDTRRDLKNTLKGLGEAQKAGAGREFNKLLDEQGEALKYSSIVNEALLGENPGDLARFIRESGVVFGALDANPQQLRNLVTDFNTTAAALADREADLRRAVGELPGTLREALPTFTALNETFPGVRRFARESLPAIRSSGPTIDATIPLVRQLRGLVSRGELRGLTRDLRAATPDLTSLAVETVPVLEETRKITSCTANILVPVGNDKVKDEMFPPSGPVHTEFGKSMPNLAGESRSGDANSQWFKVLGGGGVETLDLGGNVFATATNPVVGVNPPPVRERPPLRPEEPCENQERPDLDSRPASAPPRANNPQNSAKALARLEKSRALAIAVLQARMRESGDSRTIIDRDATLEEVRELAKQHGNLGQLETMTKKATEVLEARR